MKAIIFALLGLMASVTNAQTVVPIVWPFAVGSSQGAMVREIVQEANALQKKYIFVFDHKPGAGGAVAVQHATAQKDPVILAHTSSYFIRPYMNAEGRYDINNFIMISNYCADQPLAFISKNLSTLDDIEKKPNISVGVLMGSITQLVTAEYRRQRPKVEFIEIGYKGTPDITLDVVGGHIDLSVDWLAGVNNDQLKVLAITGTQNIGTHRTFKDQGINGLDNLTNSYYLFVNQNMDPALVAEFSDILSRASQRPRVQAFCRQDFGKPTNITGASAKNLFYEKKSYWEKQVKVVRDDRNQR